MELNVQKYLRSGKTLADLETELGIKSSEYGNLVMLNYNQLESPKTDPIVMECRQLVLEQGTWDIIFRSFHRFFNYGEALDLTQDFDFSKAVALDKIDGSIIGVFRYCGEWLMTTRGVIGGDCQVGTFPLTFKELFDLTVKQYPKFWEALDFAFLECSQNYCYTFELTSPENRVVTPYTDRALHLLTVRDRQEDFAELEREAIEVLGEEMGVAVPNMTDFDNIAALVNMASNVGELQEGFVCIDYSETDENGNFRRMKVKNPAYLAVAHLKESSASSLRSLLQLVVMGEASEFLAYFPEFTKYVEGLEEKWTEYRDRIVFDLGAASIKKQESRKEYALWAKENCLNPGVMFLYIDGKIETVQDWIDFLVTSKGHKQFGKMMMKTLQVKDIEWEIEA